MANNFNPLQAQQFSLAGSGCVIGDTTLTLKSMITIDGVLVTMSMLGLYAFMTIEPGNGSNEEQIKFTGITQNANGTATLTGVSNVSMAAPYTLTSGVLKTHAGAVTIILSNTSGFYNSFVAKDDDGTLSEVLTFTEPNFPQMDGVVTPPSLPAQLVTKSYADSLSFAGAPNASTSTKGIVQIATQAQVDAKTLIGSSSAVLVQPLNTQRSTLLSDYVLDTSPSANIITITPSPAITAYTAGQIFSFKLANTNTSAVVTINASALGTKTVLKGYGSAAVTPGDFAKGQILVVEYDGTNFQTVTTPAGNVNTVGTPAQGDVLYHNGSAWTRLGAGTSGYGLETQGGGANPQWASFAPTASSGTSSYSGATGTQTIAHGLGKIPRLLRITAIVGTASSAYSFPISTGVYDGTNNNSIEVVTNGGSGQYNLQTGSTIVFTGSISTGAANYSATATFDATNFYLAWTKVGSAAAVTFLWEVIG